MIMGLYKFIGNTTPNDFQLRLLNTSEWAVAAVGITTLLRERGMKNMLMILRIKRYL